MIKIFQQKIFNFYSINNYKLELFFEINKLYILIIKKYI